MILCTLPPWQYRRVPKRLRRFFACDLRTLVWEIDAAESRVMQPVTVEPLPLTVENLRRSLDSMIAMEDERLATCERPHHWLVEQRNGVWFLARRIYWPERLWRWLLSLFKAS